MTRSGEPKLFETVKEEPKLDIMTALTVIGQAINITKDLRDIERDLDSATYKSQMADLYGALADVKMALTDAKDELHEKDRVIRSLEETIEDMKSGEACPICEEGRMKITASVPHPTFEFAGVLERTLTCQNLECKHSEKTLYDPNKNV